MTSDFLQDLVCMCKGKSICSKNCVCVEQNVSCTSICGCQGNEECRNQLSHQLSVAENLGNDVPHQLKSRTNFDLLLIKEHNYNGKKYTMPFTEVSC
jgi:hypothetical protein